MYRVNEPKNNHFEAIRVDVEHVLRRKTRLYRANPPWRISAQFF